MLNKILFIKRRNEQMYYYYNNIYVRQVADLKTS